MSVASTEKSVPFCNQPYPGKPGHPVEGAALWIRFQRGVPQSGNIVLKITLIAVDIFQHHLFQKRQNINIFLYGPLIFPGWDGTWRGRGPLTASEGLDHQSRHEVLAGVFLRQYEEDGGLLGGKGFRRSTAPASARSPGKRSAWIAPWT
jgi:hypothetical protein